MTVPIQTDTSAFTADGETPATPTPDAVSTSTETVQESAPLPAPDDAPTPETAPAASGEAESDKETDDDGDWGFRGKDGKFRKASKREAVSELRRRVSQTTAKYHAAQQELERLKSQPASAPAPLVPSHVPASDDDPEPVFDKFLTETDPLGTYMREQAKWAARQERKSWESAAKAEAAKVEQAKAHEAFQSRVTTFTESHPDFLDVMGKPELQFSQVMLAVFRSHEAGPEMAYYLGTHPDEALSLALSTQHTPVDAQSLAAMGRLLQSRVSSAAPTGAAVPVGRSSAPRPITPVRTGRPARDDGPPDPATSSLDDHIAYYDRKDQESRRRRA